MICRKTKLTTFRNRRDVLKSMALFYFGVVLTSSSFFSVMNLQSSVNIESGLGVTSLAFFSGSMVLSGVLLSPVLAKSVSARTTIIMSDILPLCLILANIYPKTFTLLPASIVTGLGRGIFWTSSAAYTVNYAKSLTDMGTGKFTSYFSKINGCFFTSVASGQVFGNFVPFFVLGFKNLNQEDSDVMNETFNSSDSQIFSTTAKTSYSIQDICGANDCQDPAVIQDASSNFQRPSENILYLLWGILIGIHAVGTTLHILFVPLFADVDINHDDVCHKCEKEGTSNESYVQDDTGSDNRVHRNLKIFKASDANNNGKQEKENSADVAVEISNSNEANTDISLNFWNRIIAPSVKQLKATFCCFFQPSQLLLSGIEFHVGSGMSFVIAEVTRAFVSCVYGIGQIGLSMTIYGVSWMIFSFASGKISAKYGRKLCIGFGWVLNTAVYIVFISWIPDEKTSIGIIYFLLFLCGLCDAVFLTITTETSIIHHPANPQAAYSCWVIWSSLGFIVQFSWSTSLCVRLKLYIMIGVLFFGVVTYGIAEYKHTQRKQLQETRKISLNTIA